MILKSIFRFAILLLLQVFILDNVEVGGYLNPFLYVIFILSLPFETPPWLLLLSAFGMGLSVDMFTGSAGIHAAASVFMAFSRPGVINFIASRREFEPGLVPGISDLGFRWYLSYAGILIIMHHSALYFIEVFSFRNLLFTIIRIIFSVILTLSLVIISQYLFRRYKS